MKASTLAREDELNRQLLIEVYNWLAANEPYFVPLTLKPPPTVMQRRIHNRLYGPIEA